MFHSDVYFDTPTGGELLAEIGIGRDTVIEITEEDRSMRCPDRDAVLPDRPCAMLDGETPLQRALRGMPLTAFHGASPAFPPAR